MTNEQAIKILVGNRNFYERIVRPYDREMVEALNMSIKALEEQERPTGEWISNCVDYYDSLICSVCGEWLPHSDEYEYTTKYCPNCGAKMKEAEEE